ncbi:MAG: hypothetical protein CVU56_29670 [Deltaproteobacteria bacterium HGW-Deltaproteobacteria-14]|nr:MAG: hypothetical protein CVU56_29670 [Deltaproteobacteria bacterium HGW-Deltaproteobacteria-14]
MTAAAVAAAALVVALAGSGGADAPVASVAAPAEPLASAPPTAGPPGMERPGGEVAAPPRQVAMDAVALLRDTRRRTVAVIPATAAMEDDPMTAAVLADAVGVYLGFAPETISALSRRELLARAPGEDPAALTPGALVTGPSAPGRVDAVGVVTVSQERATLTVTLSWRLTGEEEPFRALSASAQIADPLAAARALAADTMALLSAPDAPQRIPPLTRSMDAWRHWLNARDALHYDRWRELESHVREALAADPGFTPALLLDAALDVDRSRSQEALTTLAAIAARPDRATPRDVSFAAVLRAELTPQERPAVVPQLEAHLARFPHDLTARLELLSLKFRMQNVGSLNRAGEYAETVLARAPATPAAASKLVRSLCWTDRCASARERVAALGLSPEMPGMGQVFGELELYEGHYGEARALFERSRDASGAVTYYAAHMSLAATMLEGDCDRAVGEGRQMLATAREAGDTLGIDWTYYLWFNALLCAGDPESARLALDEWAERTGTTAAAEGYAAYRWRVELAMGGAPSDLLAEVDAAAVDPNGRFHLEALRLLSQIGADSERLRAHAAAISKRLGGGFDDQRMRASALDRARRGLLARAELLEGHADEAVAAFEELARAGAWPIGTEGDLFDRARWLQTLAGALDEAGRPAEAEVVWRRVLNLGYERLLTMEVTLAAERRLGLLSGP